MDLELFYLKQLADSVPDYLFWKDVNSVFLGCNKNFANLAGLSHTSEIIGKTDYDLPWGEAEGDAYRADDMEVMRSKQGKFNIEETQTKGTQKSYLLTSKVPLFNQNGEISGVIGIFSDITERKKMEQELLVAKEKAESSNRAKTEFLANISHDVVTPLVSISILADQLLQNSESKLNAELILLCQNQLSTFFKNCLDNANFELESPELSEENFSMTDFFQEIYSLFITNATQKKLSLNINIDDTAKVTVLGCRFILLRIVLNLVNNAVKFTENGGITIDVNVSSASNENEILLTIAVQDTGMGIPEDKQVCIFERLTRLAPAFSKRIEGSGIGLHIVDQYVKRMGGEIHLKSEVGVGSIFTVNLPFKVT